MSEELRVSATETRGVQGKRRFAMVVDTRRCIGCMACQVACKAEYDTPLGVNRTWVPYKVVGKYPTVKKQFLPRADWITRYVREAAQLAHIRSVEAREISYADFRDQAHRRCAPSGAGLHLSWPGARRRFPGR